MVSHDFVSVDMRGMKAALVAHARSRRVGVSTVVRAAVARELGLEGSSEAVSPLRVDTDTVRISLRLSEEEAAMLAANAHEAGMARGAYVAGLISGVAVLSKRPDHLALLTVSCAELATLSRNIHHLTTLLRQGSVRAAQEYRDMLDALDVDIRRHLKVASDAVADLRSRRPPNRGAAPATGGRRAHE